MRQAICRNAGSSSGKRRNNGSDRAYFKGHTPKERYGPVFIPVRPKTARIYMPREGRPAVKIPMNGRLSHTWHKMTFHTNFWTNPTLYGIISPDIIPAHATVSASGRNPCAKIRRRHHVRGTWYNIARYYTCACHGFCARQKSVR